MLGKVEYGLPAKRGPKNSGMGRPPPSFGQCPKENVFFLLTPSLTSYQATCSENKSVLRGHYVNREYKPDVSPKIYI